jgi:hypothetical protein
MDIAHLDDNGASEQDDWRHRYSTDILKDDDFWLGAVAGFGACFVLACFTVVIVGGFAGWFG